MSVPGTPGTVENGVLFGLEDTLFLAGGAHSVFDVVSGARLVSQGSIELFRQNVRERAGWARTRKARYCHIIFPDKQSVAPDFWPFPGLLKLGEVCLAGVGSDLPVLYPITLLSAHLAETVSKVDTHTTDYGSILVAAELVTRVSGCDMTAATSELMRTLNKTETIQGDLGSKINPVRSATQRISTAPAPGLWLTNNMEGSNNGLVDLRFCAAPVFDERLVMFGDSFGRAICRFLQFWFREVIFLRTGFFHSEMAELLAPDILVTENAERYLDNTQPDEQRPHFLMYPFLKGVSYRPTTEFARAFSALLSFPRSPYIEFSNSEHMQPKRSVARADDPRPTPPSSIRLASPDDSASDVLTIEPVKIVKRVMPEFVDDLSKIASKPILPHDQDLHGSYLVNRRDVFLIGPSLQLQRNGRWSTESRAFAEQFVELIRSEAFDRSFPGPKPHILLSGSRYTADFSGIVDGVQKLNEPVFLGTPLEPLNWGRWLHTVVPKVRNFREYGADRRFMIAASKVWQRDLLAFLGLADEELILHDPGRTYLCSDLRSVEYSVTNMTVSHQERAVFEELRLRAARDGMAGGSKRSFKEKLFVSRLSLSKKHPNYRVLVNEEVLAERLTGLGYQLIEPETLSIGEQIAAYANARAIVSLGGAAVYNSVFCSPNVSFITIESSTTFFRPHCDLLSSLGLRYGVIIGEQDAADPAPVHKRWKVDVDVVARHAAAFEA